MKRIITLLSASLLVCLGAFAQKDVTAKEILDKFYSENGHNSEYCSGDCGCKAGECKCDGKRKCKDPNCSCNKDGKDEYLPICRDEAEELITRMIVEARAPYVRKRQQDQMLQRFKIETLKRRLLDQALRNTYVDEYKDRLDRMERLIMALIISNNGKLDPATVTTLFGGQGVPGNTTHLIGTDNGTPNTTTSTTVPGQSFAPGAQLAENNVVTGGTMENFLSQVFFALAKADLTPQSKETLDGVVSWMKENSTVKMALRGYASPEGNLDFNNRLSGRRVNAVADYLVSKGINRSRLEITPSGIDSITDTWPEARRVDIRPVLCE